MVVCGGGQVLVLGGFESGWLTVAAGCGLMEMKQTSPDAFSKQNEVIQKSLLDSLWLLGRPFYCLFSFVPLLRYNVGLAVPVIIQPRQ